MTPLSRPRLSILGYIIFAGVIVTVGTGALRVYVLPAESAIVASASEQGPG